MMMLFFVTAIIQMFFFILAQDSTGESVNIGGNSKENLKKDIGFNINITLSNSCEQMNGKM